MKYFLVIAFLSMLALSANIDNDDNSDDNQEGEVPEEEDQEEGGLGGDDFSFELPLQWYWPESYDPITIFCDSRSISLDWETCDPVAPFFPSTILCVLRNHLEWGPETTCSEVQFESTLRGSHPTQCHLIYDKGLSYPFESGEVVAGGKALGVSCEGFVRNKAADFGAQLLEWFKDYILHKMAGRNEEE